MLSSIRNALIFVVLGIGMAHAEGRSYMSLVGELVGMVEGARMVRDVCAVKSPSTAAKNAHLYDGWQSRHKTLLDAAAEQIARANVRLKKQGAPGENPVEFMVVSGRRLLEEHLAGMTPAQVQEYCGAYADLIAFKDREATDSLRKLLGIVTNADEALSEREKT